MPAAVGETINITARGRYTRQGLTIGLKAER
jgi:hypothetical protein